MTEQEDLKKIGAKDWRSLNKNQIMKFIFETSTDLSDEVCLRILEYAPVILNTAKDIVSGFQDLAQKTLVLDNKAGEKILEQNHDSVKAIYAGYHESSEKLGILLSDPNASFVEKQYWNSEMLKYLREMHEFDKENKDFLTTIYKEKNNLSQTILKYSGAAAIIVFGSPIA